MITMILYYIIILPISLLPHPALHLISKAIYFISYEIIGYRKKIVTSNIKNAFPNKNEKELKEIIINFYHHFADIIMEITKTLSANKNFLNKRVLLNNKQLIDNYADQNQTIILVCGHFNNWEWAGQKLSISAKQKVVSIYKSLNNKKINRIIKRARTKFGARAISMEESMRHIIETKKETKIICIISDQNPVVKSNTRWYSFFKREVPVFMGTEKIAKKMNYPVVFCDMQKTKKGKYTITFEDLARNPKETNDGDITKIYFERLEKQIKENPSQWLWSHNRWKHTK